MATRRIMSWNIQNLGSKKEDYQSILESIAQTVINYSVDIFIVVELRSISVLKKLSLEINRIQSGATGKDYLGFFHSPSSYTKGFYSDTLSSHHEYYGFIVKDAKTVVPYGFKGPLDEYASYTDSTQQLTPLTLTTGYGNKGFSYSFYLYNKRFIGGRPPCWAQFQEQLQQGVMNVNVIALHLRPDLYVATEQLNNLAAFDLVQNVKQTLIITGDFNTNSGQILNRGDGDNINTEIANRLAKYNCYPAFNRGTATHISDEVYDNFYTRNYGNIIGNAGIVPFREVLGYLLNNNNAQAELLQYIITYKDRVILTGYINQMFAQGVNSLTDDEARSIFKIVSDHYPIFIDVTQN
jgi:hypothetical protein